MKAYVETYFENNAEVPITLKRGALTFEQQLEVVLKEVHAFRIVPHLLWGLWSIKNSIDSINPKTIHTNREKKQKFSLLQKIDTKWRTV